MTDLSAQLHRQEADDDDDDDEQVDMVVYSAKQLRSSEDDDVPRRHSFFNRYRASLRHLLPIRPSCAASSTTQQTSSDNRSCPIDRAGVFSFVTYSWMFAFLWTSLRRQRRHNVSSSSSEHDAPYWPCSMYDSSSINMARIEYLWRNELKRCPTSPSLLRVVVIFVRTRLIVSCAVFLFCLMFGFIGPTCLIRGIIAHAETRESKTLMNGVWFVLALLLVEIARVMSYGATWAVSYRTGIRVRGAILALLFKRLAHARSLRNRTSAEIINIYANDGQRLFDAVTFAPLVMMGPLVLIGGIVYLLIIIGPWSLLGIVVFLLFDCFQYFLGKTMVRCRNSAIEKTEKRINLMGEILRCIRVIKMNAWENVFMKRIDALRRNERSDLQTAGYAQSLAIAAGPVVPVVAAIVTFLAVIYSGHDLLASDAFSAITVFFVMLFGIRMIPYGTRYVAEASVALRRIQVLLQISEYNYQMPNTNNIGQAIVFKNATFRWEDDPVSPDNSNTNGSAMSNGNNTTTATTTPASFESFRLSDINLIIPKNKLIGICGPVGAGKTALLHSIIGHLIQDNGELQFNGSLALVAQSSWIQNLSFRENILFGKTFDTKSYYQVLKACALTADISHMVANDMTEIGERGVTLSGGQKARLSLARALYANRDIYLIDDVLVSIDYAVADHVFKQAIQTLLANKTVLFVSNDVRRLMHCNQVVYMECGRIVDFGTHNQLHERCSAYRQYCTVSSNRLHNSTTIDSYFNVETKPESNNHSESIRNDKETSPLVDEKTRTQSVLTAYDSLFDIPSATDGNVVDAEEDFGFAAVSWSVYKRYISSAGNVCIWILLLFAFLFNIGSSIFSTFWLSYWIKYRTTSAMMDVNDTFNGTSIDDDGNMTNNPLTTFFAGIYGLSIILLFSSGICKALTFVKVTLNAASRLHNSMFARVLHGTMTFFDATPTGRILNRFTKDMDEIDVKLPFTAEVFLQNMLTCIGYLLMISWVFPHFLIVCIPLLVVFALFVACFRAGIRSIKRSENVSRSPLFDHISATLDGLSTVHAFDETDRFITSLKSLLDANSAAVFMFQSAMRWLAVWLDLLVVAVTFVTALFIVSGRVEPAYAGMALTFAIQMSGIFQFAVRTQTELEAKMTSVERVAYYAEHIQTDNDMASNDFRAPTDWPSAGRISFRDVKLKYRLNMPLALDSVSFDVKSKEKIGIVGRTGSGKSSLGNALFRLYSLTWGSISIDTVDISLVGLHQLRRAIAVIPQDPSLFADTVRFNLDPNGTFNDSELWTALESTYLKDQVSSMDGQLDAQISEGGSNLSVGERQLMCLARALLRNVRILLLDEATASLDANTDQLIRRCLNDAFKECTVLMIAHRLDSVMHMDKILFMDSGKVMEFDSPTNLLQNKNSHFYQLLNRSNAADKSISAT